MLISISFGKSFFLKNSFSVKLLTDQNAEPMFLDAVKMQTKLSFRCHVEQNLTDFLVFFQKLVLSCFVLRLQPMNLGSEISV